MSQFVRGGTVSYATVPIAQEKARHYLLGRSGTAAIARVQAPESIDERFQKALAETLRGELTFVPIIYDRRNNQTSPIYEAHILAPSNTVAGTLNFPVGLVIPDLKFKKIHKGRLGKIELVSDYAGQRFLAASHPLLDKDKHKRYIAKFAGISDGGRPIVRIVTSSVGNRNMFDRNKISLEEMASSGFKFWWD